MFAELEWCDSQKSSASQILFRLKNLHLEYTQSVIIVGFQSENQTKALDRGLQTMLEAAVCTYKTQTYFLIYLKDVTTVESYRGRKVIFVIMSPTQSILYLSCPTI